MKVTRLLFIAYNDLYNNEVKINTDISWYLSLTVTAGDACPPAPETNSFRHVVCTKVFCKLGLFARFIWHGICSWTPCTMYASWAVNRYVQAPETAHRYCPCEFYIVILIFADSRSYYMTSCHWNPALFLISCLPSCLLYHCTSSISWNNSCIWMLALCWDIHCKGFIDILW